MSHRASKLISKPLGKRFSKKVASISCFNSDFCRELHPRSFRGILRLKYLAYFRTNNEIVRTKTQQLYFENFNSDSKLYIYSKYSKHWLYLLAYTIDCDCNKIFNHGLFLSLFQVLGVKIHSQLN
jgi:hypothetical protein